jgi:hypothetical protein
MRISGEKLRRALLASCWLSLLIALAAGAGCKQSSVSGEPARANVEESVPAPDGLVSELFIPHPDRLWASARTSLGAGLPVSPAIFLGGAIGLPVTALDQLDVNIPIVGALMLDGEDIDTLAAIHVKDGSRLVGLMTSATPPFTKDEKTSPGLVFLSGPVSGGWSLGVSGNYLVLASSNKALARSAPFVTRTLPKRAMPEDDLVATIGHKALAGPVKARLDQLWKAWKKDREAEDVTMRKQHGGSAPDFGDPTQALADIESKTDRFFSILGDLEDAQLALHIQDAAYRATLSMKASSRTGPAATEIASMSVGGAEPLLSLPASVSAALLTRDSQQLREESASSQVEAISKVLGGRLDENDKTKVANAFHSWSKGRGDWLTAGLMWSGGTRTAVVRAAVSDPGELGQATSGLFKLLGVRAIADPLSNWVGDMKLTGLTANAPEGAVQSVHIVRRPPKVQLHRERDKPPESDAFDVVFSIDKQMLVGAAGKEARSAYNSLAKANGEATLGQDAFAKTIFARLGPTISFALLVDTARLSGDSAKQSASLVIAYGKDPQSTDRAWFEVDVPSTVLTTYAAAAATVFGGGAGAPSAAGSSR